MSFSGEIYYLFFRQCHSLSLLAVPNGVPYPSHIKIYFAGGKFNIELFGQV